MDHSLSPVLAAAALMAALAYWLGYCWRESPGQTGAALKTVSTGLLAAILALWALDLNPALWPMALGLALGALGDWLLAQRSKAAFLSGMGAFGIGHLVYAGAMLIRGADIGFDGLSAAELAAGAALLMLLISTEVWLAPRTGALRGPVRAYVAMIGAMAMVLAILPGHPGQGMLRLGGALFILSDLLLALRLFVVADPARQRRLSLALWPAYWAGQALIGLAALSYWAPMG